MLHNVKSSLRSGKIAAAVGGFNFICEADFIQALLGFHREHKRTISLSLAPLPLLCYYSLKVGDFMKAVLFDFDGVLTIDKYGSDSILRYLGENTDVPIEVLKKEYYKLNKGLLYGQYTHKDIWNEYCINVDAEIDFQILVDSFIKTPLDNEMISIVKELKKKYLIGMITDNKVDRIDTILKYHCLTDLFDTVTVSAQCKCGKNDRKIFDITLGELSVEPSDCVFIDNSEKNLIVPTRMGIHTILFDDEKRDINEFNNKLSELLKY